MQCNNGTDYISNTYIKQNAISTTQNIQSSAQKCEAYRFQRNENRPKIHIYQQYTVVIRSFIYLPLLESGRMDGSPSSSKSVTVTVDDRSGRPAITNASAHLRQTPQTAQPLSPSPQPHFLLLRMIYFFNLINYNVKRYLF